MDGSAKAGALAAIFARMLDSARRFRAAGAPAGAFHDLHFDPVEAHNLIDRARDAMDPDRP